MVAVADLVLFTPHPGHHHILPAIFHTAKASDAVLPQYAAVVGEVNSDGSADLFVLVPNKEAVWMDNVPEGTGAFTWTVRGAAAPTPLPANDAAKAPVEAVQAGEAKVAT